MIEYFNYGVVWYAMKTTFKKELKAKAYLDSRGIENFIPMQKEVSTKYGCKKVILKPALHNLIFVKADLPQLNNIKISLNYIHNCLSTENGISMPIIVPSIQMEQFIDIVTNHLDEVVYVDLKSSLLPKGTRVRITGGKFKGYEGQLERVKGKKDRRILVNINGISAYRFEVEASSVEKI